MKTFIILLFSTCTVLAQSTDFGANTLKTTGAISIGGLTNSGLTATTVPYTDANKAQKSSAVTPTELGYLSGVSSAVQTQLDAKQATLGFNPVQPLFSQVTDSPNSGSSLTVLFTNTIAAGKLASNGDTIDFHGVVSFTGATANTFIIKFGTTTIFTITASGVEDDEFEGHIYRTGAATQKAIVVMSAGTGGNFAMTYSNPTATLSGAVGFSITMQTAAGSGTLRAIKGIYTPAQ